MTVMNARQSFEALVWGDSEILILGTIPSSSSIEKNEYYYHYANYIWDYLAKIYDEPRPRTWTEKKEFLHRHHIALWDMYKYSEVPGSVDKGLGTFNELAGFLQEHPTIIKVLLNGKKAAQAFQEYTEKVSAIPEYVRAFPLPSTSGANTRISKDDVLRAWREAVVLTIDKAASGTSY